MAGASPKLARIEAELADARSGTPSAAPSYRMDAVGRLLWLMTALRIPVKTTDPFVSPFDARLRYNRYSAFRLTAAHQRLHCRQAEQALRTVRASLMDRR
ncbi:MAG: hypothetical protein HYU41_05745 [Candidatus Rokubacteria bacterium]|nr:hypothetical protein [Candidatus Rokubacteria bacterium]